MSGQGNLLDYLREAKRDLTPEQQRICDDFVIGILSLHVSEQVWRDAVDHGRETGKEGKAMLNCTPWPWTTRHANGMAAAPQLYDGIARWK